MLAILGLLIGLVAPAALRQLESSKEKIAHQSIERIAGVLDIYKLDVGVYPTTEQGPASFDCTPFRGHPLERALSEGRKCPARPVGPALYLPQPSLARRA